MKLPDELLLLDAQAGSSHSGECRTIRLDFIRGLLAQMRTFMELR
jgi:hypothetical protein